MMPFPAVTACLATSPSPSVAVAASHPSTSSVARSPIMLAW